MEKQKTAILIDNRCGPSAVPPARIRRAAAAALNALGSPDGELSIVLLDDAAIAAINREYLNRSGPTNVIAFPMREGPFSEITPALLGDVVISMETAAREAEAAGIPMETRFLELLVHGILHLFGFDHETDPTNARRMEQKSAEILEHIHHNI
ncbi:MAG: rRNA maturation RNase YbeY [Deltaproteobacteria bacterium]|nr:rRNA maturation RNase YbeY [Deltaproteobacteria bacterium]MBW2043041.1 rRNA maturation RNase YbeY [Deltaproteobacteria bacterium]MBW2133379.1 rRNA maturation RNase YbeY [Deltaproteobacteria bacterium]